MAKVYSYETRVKAIELFERGLGRNSISKKLGISRDLAKRWAAAYRAVGREVFLEMGAKRRNYDFETKVAAASAVVDDGRPKAEVMREYGIVSRSPLDDWCREYRAAGAEGLRPRPKGRPKAGSAPATREEELEREIRKLEAQVAYLKKSIALKAELGLLPERGQRP